MGAQPHTDDNAWTVGRLLAWTTEYLAGQGLDEPRLASEILLAHALEARRIDLYARFDRVPDGAQVGRFRSWVQRAARHEPIAYLVGEKEFFSLSFKVTPDVLIPRPETEMVVEMAIDHCREAGLAEPRIADVGTGSGCIAVSALVNLEGGRAVGSDVSPAALEVARGNAARHGVLDRLTLVEADRFALPDDVVPSTGFDVIMSNPPYIAVGEMAGLDQTVREYEPRRALTDEADGLSFYRGLLADGPGVLVAGGVVIVEVGDSQADFVVATLTQTGALVHVETRKDRVVGKERTLMFALG